MSHEFVRGKKGNGMTRFLKLLFRMFAHVEHKIVPYELHALQIRETEKELDAVEDVPDKSKISSSKWML